MKVSKSEPGAVISAAAHVALLAATLIVFADTKKFDDVQESIPVEMISDTQFSQIMKGEKTAKQVQPKQRVDKIAAVEETRPTPPLAEAKRDIPTPPPPLKRIPDPGEADKPDVPTPPQRVAALPPTPEPPPRPEPKPEAVKPIVKAEPPQPKVVAPPEHEDPKEAEIVKPQPVPRPKVAEAPKEESIKPIETPKPIERPKEPVRPKLDEVAKLLEQKKLEEKMAALAEKPKPEKPVAKPKSGEESDDRKPSLDLAAISQLLSKEAPQARASTGRELTRTAALGAPTASAVKMSPSMWAALDSFMMDAYKRCWTYIGTNPDKYVPKLHIRFRPDGSLASEPSLDNPAATAQTRILADSAMRAVRQCNPLRIPAQFLPYYEEWKARLVRFDNEEMF